MAKIENLSVYPLTSPSADDFLVGTDTSNDNRTVSFRVADIAAAGALQGLQSVLDTGNTATQSIDLTGNITVVGTVYPTTITAAGTVGLAGQILSSTGTGIQWINAAADQDLQSVLTVGNTTTLDIVTSGNINSTGSITMNGAAQTLALSNGVDMTLAANSSITTEDNIVLGNLSVLNFNTTTRLNDSTGSAGLAGQILTVNGAGTGVEWSTGVPSASMPTLQQVLTAGNTAVGIGMAFSGVSTTTFSATSDIQSAGNNVFTGFNAFSANGATPGTAAINLTGSLSDGVGTGTLNQVLTSTATGVSWQTLSGIGIIDVNAATPVDAANPNTPITVLTPAPGIRAVRQNIYKGADLIGCVPPLGTAGTFLQGDGTWATPAGGVSSVSAAASATSTGAPLVITPTTGAVVVTPQSYAGGANVGHVPAGGSATTFLRGDGTWVNPVAKPEYNKYLKFANSKWTVAAAGDYMINGGVGDVTLGVTEQNFAVSHGASAPSAVAVTDARLMANIIAANTTTGCLTSYPSMQLCQVSYQWFVDQAADYTFDIWKVQRTGGVANISVVATATVTTAASTLTTGDLTITAGSVSILSNTNVYILTVRSNTTFTNKACSLGLTLKFQGTV